MAGRKQFDKEKTLEAAMVLFWRQGYEATSLADIELATGLNKSSIYNAFQSKEVLYAQCLQRYIFEFTAVFSAQLKHADFQTAIDHFFNCLLSVFENSTLPSGCFSSMAAMELGDSEHIAASLIVKSMEQMQDAFERRCQQAVVDRQLDINTNCAELAALLLSVARGVAVFNRGYGDIHVARQAIAGVLNVIVRLRVDQS